MHASSPPKIQFNGGGIQYQHDEGRNSILGRGGVGEDSVD